jgi:hypothetical protein
MNKVYADQAVMQQPVVCGIAPLSAAPLGIGAFGLPVSWLTVAPIAAKPGDTTVQINHKYMTRTVANSDGGSGSHPPLRERPPA